MACKKRQCLQGDQPIQERDVVVQVKPHRKEKEPYINPQHLYLRGQVLDPCDDRRLPRQDLHGLQRKGVVAGKGRQPRREAPKAHCYDGKKEKNPLFAPPKKNEFNQKHGQGQRESVLFREKGKARKKSGPGDQKPSLPGLLRHTCPHVTSQSREVQTCGKGCQPLNDIGNGLGLQGMNEEKESCEKRHPLCHPR